jgi:hypothetical protein
MKPEEKFRLEITVMSAFVAVLLMVDCVLAVRHKYITIGVVNALIALMFAWFSVSDWFEYKQEKKE